VNLSNWVRNLRRKKIRGTLSSEKIAKLEELGFVWRKERKDSWEEHFAQLIEFKERFVSSRRHASCLLVAQSAKGFRSMRAIQVWPLSCLQELEGERQIGTMGAGTKDHSSKGVTTSHTERLNACWLSRAESTTAEALRPSRR
jgi:hypothetical protein